MARRIVLVNFIGLLKLPKFDEPGEQNLISAANQLPVFGKPRTI
jgi:hypothetical protein